MLKTPTAIVIVIQVPLVLFQYTNLKSMNMDWKSTIVIDHLVEDNQ